MSEKTEKATPWKLKKAREKGQVSKSIELNTCIYLLVFLGALTAFGNVSLHQIQLLMKKLLHISAQTYFSVDSMMRLFKLIFSELLSLWLPLASLGFITLILTSILQTGFIWTFKPVIPSWNRLNPVQGFKKIASSRTIFDTLKNLLKLTLAGITIYISLKLFLPKILRLSQLPAVHPASSQFILSRIVLQLLLMLTALAILDVLYNRWKFAKEQRMSTQEVRDEYKQREGDPRIKSRIRQLQNQLRKKSASINQVKHAQVLITNPEHIAIALKYDRQTMPAPMLVCKVHDDQVEAVKNLARKHQIPIIENKPLARILFHNIELNHWITPDLYPMVAEVFRSVLESRNPA